MPRLSSQTWRADHPWAPVYDRIVEHEQLGPLLWRVGLGTDLGKLHRAAARELGAVPDGASVLDIPCGGGVVLRDIPAGRRLRYVAADIAPAMLRRTREEAERRGVPGVELVEADVQDLSFDDASFDLVIAFTSLHCFPQPGAAVAELARCLRSGGRITGSAFLNDTGLVFEPMRRIGRVTGLLGPSGTRADLRRWLEEAGLRDIALDRSGGLTYFEATKPA